jgi:predicted metal-binding membrane protein
VTIVAAIESTVRTRRVDRIDAAAPVSRSTSSNTVPALIAAAWVSLLVAQATGAAAALHHHELIEDGPPLAVAIPLFLGGWLVMVAAMMLPASLPTMRDIEATSRHRSRPVLVEVRFLAGFGLVWAVFGLAAFLGDIAVHRLVDATPWIAEHPYLIETGILTLAGAYQFGPHKRQALHEFRDVAGLVSTATAASSAPPSVSAARLGLRHGLACLGSSWALMLVMFGEGFGGLGWMVALTAVMIGESNGRHGDRTARIAGIALLLAALSVLSAP